jgi:hypothetical protein
MNINFFSDGASPFAHIERSTTKVSMPEFEGRWSTLELQPDLFVPQHFTVGVVVQASNDRLHYHLLSDFKKFECIYANRFPKKTIREMFSHAEEVLRAAVRDNKSLENVEFNTSNLFLSKSSYTSGASFDVVVDRLYNGLVVLEPHITSKVRQFESLDNPAVRDLVNCELKKIAAMDYEKIVLDSKSGFSVEDGDRTHYFDINLRTTRACGSVVSAIYKTAQSIEMNLLRANIDLSTFSKIKNIKEKGVFLMLPDRSDLDGNEWNKIGNLVDEQSWKLEKDGFRVVSLDSAHEIAKEIYDWAKPTI